MIAAGILLVEVVATVYVCNTIANSSSREYYGPSNPYIGSSSGSGSSYAANAPSGYASASSIPYAASLQNSKAKDKENSFSKYYGADIYGGTWKLTTGPMNFTDTTKWVYATSASNVYGKGASWGLFTANQNDAYMMAVTLGNGQAPIIHYATDENFAHYHVNGFIFDNKYKHFHIWFANYE